MRAGHGDIACGYRFGKFRESGRARGGCTALARDAVLRDRWNVDDRVDPVLCDVELEGQFDVAAADKVDEGGARRSRRGCGDALTNTTAVGDRSRSALEQPWVMALACHCDDARTNATSRTAAPTLAVPQRRRLARTRRRSVLNLRRLQEPDWRAAEAASGYLRKPPLTCCFCFVAGAVSGSTR